MPNTNEYERWWTRTAPEGETRLRMFLFPFAGGAAGVFHGWGAKLPQGTATAALQMPGRENRLREPPVRSMAEAVDRIVENIQPLLDVPACFFGYSLGGLMAFETARALRRKNLPQPLFLFTAATTAPQCDHSRQPPIHLLPDADLIEEIRRVGGTPEFVLRNPEIMGLIMPMIRADFEILETYRCAAEAPLPMPLVAYGGLQDGEVAPDLLAEWSSQTASSFRMKFFPGDHFFLRSAADELLADVAGELTFLEFAGLF
jgi:medium-chain acyl-[acyl-carrier-protein] hydrolase